MLLVRPNMFADESLGSIARRVATSNGYRNWRDFARVIGFAKLELARPERQQRFLQAVNALGINVPVELLRGPSKRFNRREQRQFAFNAGLSAVCPLCLSEHAYARITWEHEAYFACHRHAVLMLCECPRCSMALDPNRLLVEFCTCHFDLRRACVLAASAVPMRQSLEVIQSQDSVRVTELEKFAATSKIISRVLGSSDYFPMSFQILWSEEPEAHRRMTKLAVDTINFLHPRLSLLPFLLTSSATAQVAEDVLRNLNGTRMLRKTKCTSQLTLSEFEAACALGLLPLNRMPVYVRNFFKSLEEKQGEGRYPISLIDRLLRKLWRPGPDSHSNGRLARAEFISCSRFALGGRSWNGRYLMQAGLSSLYEIEPGNVYDHEMVSPHAAALQLKIPIFVMNSLIRFGHLRCQVPAGEGARYLSQIEVNEFRKRFAFATELSGLLPLTGRIHDQLRRRGIAPYAGPSIDGMPVYIFEWATLQKYFTWLRQRWAASAYAKTRLRRSD